MWVNSVQIRNGRISDAEAFLLGRAERGGIPAVGPVDGDRSVGFRIRRPWSQHRFNLNIWIRHDGPNGTARDKTTFRHDHRSLGIIAGPGVEAKVMRVQELEPASSAMVDHRIAPNGGGTRVNQYTLIMDVFVADTGAGAASLWQNELPEQHR